MPAIGSGISSQKRRSFSSKSSSQQSLALFALSTVVLAFQIQTVFLLSFAESFLPTFQHPKQFQTKSLVLKCATYVRYFPLVIPTRSNHLFCIAIHYHISII